MPDNLNKIIISGTGCALGDYLYDSVSYENQGFKRYLSQRSGDGGLSPGRLVFTEDIEKFAKKPYSEILNDIIGHSHYSSFNAGGPSLVSLIHASQLIGISNYEVRFFGIAGKDEISAKLFKIINKTPLNIDNYYVFDVGSTPFTHVFSDPYYEKRAGERTFLNNIGTAWNFYPDMLNDEFFDSDITCFGGTALVPNIHDNLTQLLLKAKRNSCITVVNTVYDFRSEKNNPNNSWQLVSDKKYYELIDILIMDCEEAMKISGKDNINDASDYFISSNVSSFFITNGANNVYFYSSGKMFGKTDLLSVPVSDFAIKSLIKEFDIKGDTTGCGDNFAGGIIASLAWQVKTKRPGNIDIIEAVTWGVASGGFACFMLGGVYHENYHGEKLKKVKSIRDEYLRQMGIIKQ